MSVVLLILGLVLFVALVVLHELGHAIVARRNGVVVEEFGIGFPPRAWAKRLKSGMWLSLNWLPLGGFVNMKGAHDSSNEPGSYGCASTWVKTKILLAGVLINWLTAAVIFTVIALIGMPQVFNNQFTIESDTVTTSRAVVVAAVVPDSPAQKNGLQAGDIVRKLAGQDITTAQQLIDQASSHAGQEVSVVYDRSGKSQEAKVTLNKEGSTHGYLGISPQERISHRSTWSAPIVGVGVTAQFTYETIKGLVSTVGELTQAKFSEASEHVAGPIGIFGILKDTSEAGLIPVLFFVGVISLTLAVMNALPIPALDGGRLFVMLLFKAIRQPLTKRREEIIQSAGFAVLMLIIVLVSIVDVGRFFG